MYYSNTTSVGMGPGGVTRMSRPSTEIFGGGGSTSLHARQAATRSFTPGAGSSGTSRYTSGGGSTGLFASASSSYTTTSSTYGATPSTPRGGSGSLGASSYGTSGSLRVPSFTNVTETRFAVPSSSYGSSSASDFSSGAHVTSHIPERPSTPRGSLSSGYPYVSTASTATTTTTLYGNNDRSRISSLMPMSLEQQMRHASTFDSSAGPHGYGASTSSPSSSSTKYPDAYAAGRDAIDFSSYSNPTRVSATAAAGPSSSSSSSSRPLPPSQMEHVTRGRLDTPLAAARTNPLNSTSVYAPSSPPTLQPSSSSSALLAEPVGFRNMGNTCYLNATLQCVVHSHGLLYKIAREQQQKRTSLYFCSPSADRSPRSLTEIVDALCKREFATERGVLLTSVRKEAARINPEFANSYTQNDAHEFLRALLMAMHTEINRTKGRYQEMKDIPGEADDAAANRWRDYHRQHDDSVIYDTFGGLLKTATMCKKCGNRSLSFDPFLDLSIPISGSNEALENLVTKFTAEEHLTGTERFHCAMCKKAQDAYRRLTVQDWPELLVVHLKRFNSRGVKNSAELRFSDNLAVQPQWTSHDNNYDGRTGFYELTENIVATLPKYALTGVVCHTGTSGYGHYYSYVMVENGAWYLCDDSTIRGSSVREAISEAKNAYVLFYARR